MNDGRWHLRGRTPYLCLFADGFYHNQRFQFRAKSDPQLKLKRRCVHIISAPDIALYSCSKRFGSVRSFELADWFNLQPKGETGNDSHVEKS